MKQPGVLTAAAVIAAILYIWLTKYTEDHRLYGHSRDVPITNRDVFPPRI